MEPIILVAFLPMEGIINNLSNAFSMLTVLPGKKARMWQWLQKAIKLKNANLKSIMAITTFKLVVFLRIKMMSLLLILSIMRPKETYQW